MKNSNIIKIIKMDKQTNKRNEKLDKLNNLASINSFLIQEINEIMSEQEEIKKNILNYNKNYIELELSIPESLTQSAFPIKFILKISMKFPSEEPELYCITKFSYPHIYDGRNLIDEVLKSKWKSDKYTLDTIINRVPKFIIEFNSSLEDGYLLLVGKYIINHLYSTERIREFPIFIKNVKEIQKINNKITKINKILTISDLSFCLFEKVDKHYSKLTFQNDLNNLISIKRNTEQNTITFIWKNKNDENDKIEVIILTQDTEEIKSILLEKMELFGKEYNVNQKIIKKRMGKLPCTDIEKVEKQIKLMEKEFEDKKNVNMDIVHRLMSLYQKSVEYYSAINSPQFKVYTDKIKELMGTQKINDLIDKSEESKESTDDSINMKIIPKKEKEEKMIIQGLNKIKNKFNSISGKKEKKKANIPKIALSKEDEDGGNLDVGDDEEEEEEEDENENTNEKNEEIKDEDKNDKKIEEVKKEEEIKDEDKKDKKIEEEKKEEEINSVENKITNEIKDNNKENNAE